MWPGLVGAHGSLNIRIESIEDSLIKADVDIDLIEKEHKDIKIDVTKVENNVQKLKVEVDKLEVRIKSIEDKGPSIHQKIKDIIARIDVLEASYKSYDISIDKAKTFDVDIMVEIDALRARIDFLSGLCDPASGKIVHVDQRLTDIKVSHKEIRIDIDAVHKQNMDFAAQLDNLDTKHTRADLRLTKVEKEIKSVEAELESISVTIDTINTKSSDILKLEKTLKDTINGYSQRTSDVDSRLDIYQLQWGKTESSVVSVSGYTSKYESRKINEMVYDGKADSNDKCFEGCADCRKGHYSLYPKYDVYQCVHPI